MNKIITEEEHFALNIKTSKNDYDRAKYEGFNKTVNGFKLVDHDYDKLEKVINDGIFRLLTVLLPLHPKYIDKVCDAIREVK